MSDGQASKEHDATRRDAREARQTGVLARDGNRLQSVLPLAKHSPYSDGGMENWRFHSNLRTPSTVRTRSPLSGRSLCAACIVAVIAFATGCSQQPQVTEAGFADRPRGLVSLDEEWRRAWTLESGVRHVENLEILGTRPVLRLGVLVFNDSTAPVEREILAGGEVIFSDEIRNPGAWDDLVLPLPDVSAGSVTVRLRSEQDFAVGPCEIVDSNAEASNILILLIDTLRLDHLGCYGYDRRTSPSIDAFAEHAVVFTQLMPQSSWTRPSVASLLTSTYPPVHGANTSYSRVNFGTAFLSAELNAHGYETQGFVSNPSLLPTWGFGLDYDRYYDVDSREGPTMLDDAKVVDRVLASLPGLAGKPWFFYVHMMGPHSPYTPPAPYDKAFESAPGVTAGDTERRQAVDLYDGEILYTDAQFGRLVARLKELGQYDNTLFVVVSDHGEEFWEHGVVGHGKSLHETLLRVPLLIKLPNSLHAGERREGLIEMVDIAPTILDLVGLPAHARFQGKSLVKYIETGTFESKLGYASLVHRGNDLVCVKSLHEKFLEDAWRGEAQWFDLRRDPGELSALPVPHDRSAAFRDRAMRLQLEASLGLHVLVIFAPGDETPVGGRVACQAMGSHRFFSAGRRVRIVPGDDSISFTIRPVADVSSESGDTACDYVHLFVSMWPNASPTLEIERDGKPISADAAVGGPDFDPLDVQGGTLDLKALTGPANLVDPGILNPAFRVYVWYVMPPKTLEDDEIDPATKEALKALGYLDE